MRTRNRSWLRIASICGALAVMTPLAVHSYEPGAERPKLTKAREQEHGSRLMAPEPNEPLLRAIAMRNVYGQLSPDWVAPRKKSDPEQLPR